MVKSDYERFLRWQGVTREHLGNTSNLVLGLATGLLGFATFLLLDEKLEKPCPFALGFISSVLLMISGGLALWCSLNRLADFRLTAKIAHPKYHDAPQLEDDREKSRRLGEHTWNLFTAQIWSFAFGAGFISVGIIVQVCG